MEKDIIKTDVLFFEGEIIYIPILEFFTVDRLIEKEDGKNIYEVTPIREVSKVHYIFDEEDELEFIQKDKNTFNPIKAYQELLKLTKTLTEIKAKYQ